MMIPLILHIPHASTYIPPGWQDQILISQEQLDRAMLEIIDHYTDELYDHENAQRIVFPVARLVVDPERFADDALESSAKKGMGVIYTKTPHQEDLRPAPTSEERRVLLETYYAPHHHALTQAAQDTLDTHGRAVIVDCHSFPQFPSPYEGRPMDEQRPQICIGTDAYHTPNWMRDVLVSFFKGQGLSVDIDTPFAGALVPTKFYQKNKNVHSVMIETRRDLYMDETTGEKNADFSAVQKMLRRALETLHLADSANRA